MLGAANPFAPVAFLGQNIFQLTIFIKTAFGKIDTDHLPRPKPHRRNAAMRPKNRADEKRSVDVGEIGEIVVRGRCVIEAYEARDHLGYDLNAVFSLAKGTNRDGEVHQWHGLPFPTPITVRECLTRYLDLTSAPRRSDLKLLSSYARQAVDRKALLRLSSKEGKPEYKPAEEEDVEVEDTHSRRGVTGWERVGAATPSDATPCSGGRVAVERRKSGSRSPGKVEENYAVADGSP